MALDAEEQELFDFAIAAMPHWFTSDARQREELYGFAKMFGSVRAVIVYWFQQTYISGALGPVTGLPDWLNQHAIDLGTRRQFGETDDALRIRLRNTPDALTRTTLISAAQAIIDADGVSGTVGMVELPRDGAHSGIYTAMTGVGGEFTAPNAGGTMGFAPLTGWPTPPVDSTHTGYPWKTWLLTTAGAMTPGNDVTESSIDGTDATPQGDLDGNFAAFSNVLGAAEVDATVAWTANKLVHGPWIADGHARAYSRRGYRSARARPPGIVFILPYGTTEGTAASVRELARQKKAAGVVVRIERRLSPP